MELSRTLFGRTLSVSCWASATSWTSPCLFLLFFPLWLLSSDVKMKPREALRLSVYLCRKGFKALKPRPEYDQWHLVVNWGQGKWSRTHCSRLMSPVKPAHVVWCLVKSFTFHVKAKLRILCKATHSLLTCLCVGLVAQFFQESSGIKGGSITTEQK